ncbi:MAG: GntR family transcriptional regulator [Anaerolineales bacterium]|nr:GntR family transcriptional regulator [Anaerolineales bacterium]
MSDASQAKPLYQTVMDSIFEKIKSGAYTRGVRLPSESDLQTEYNVGRNTIRRALQELTNQGILQSVHGVGTFIVEERFTKTAEFLLGLSQELAQHGKTITSQVLDQKVISADPFLARRLQIQLGAEVFYLYRLRLMDGDPTALERAYLPYDYCRGLMQKDFSTESLYAVLSEECGMRPDHADQEIKADLATKEVAELLGLQQPAVVLIFHRDTRTADGRVIEYVESELRGDKFQFYTNLKANSPTQSYIFERFPVGTRHE